MGEEDLDVGFLLKRISTAIVRNADQGFKPITLSQMRVMMYIAHQQGHACCQKDIEARFGVAHPTVVGLLKRLEAKGLVVTSMSEKDTSLPPVMRCWTMRQSTGQPWSSSCARD